MKFTKLPPALRDQLTPPKRQAAAHAPIEGDGADLVAALHARGIVHSEPDPGKLWLRECLWQDEHSNPNDRNPGVAGFFLPSDEYPVPHYHCFHASCDGKRTLNDVREALGLEAFSSRDMTPNFGAQNVTAATEPEPLRREVPPAEPYPMDALGGILGPAAQRIHETIRAPDAVCGQSILAAASLAVQSHADVALNDSIEPLSLWAVTIASSGERKSVVDTIVLAPHREYERAALELFREQEKEYLKELRLYETRRKIRSKGNDIEKIEAALEDLGDPPEKPLNQTMLVRNPTLEGIHKMYQTGQPNLGLFHDDAGEFLGGHSMGKDHRTKTASAMSSLWDRGEFDRVRAGDGVSKSYGRRFAMHLLLQPVIADSILSDAVLTGQGFLARALLAWPQTTISGRPFVDESLRQDPIMMRYRELMTALLQFRPCMRDGTRNELEPRVLTVGREAKDAWKAIHDSIEADMGPCGQFECIIPWAAKAAFQILRVAGVLTLVDNPAAQTIDSDAILRAEKIIRYSLGEAVRIVGYAAVPVEIRNAQKLLDWCHSNGISELCASQALTLGPNAIRSKRAFDAAIQELENTGWAVLLPPGTVVDGKPRRRAWRIVGQD